MITVKIVRTRSDLKSFIRLPFEIYKDNPFWVPPLNMDERETFNQKKNLLYQGAETRLFLALVDGRPVGRIAGILSHAANQKNKTKNLRFSWFETVEDLSVAQALFDNLEAWALEKGMETVTGPQGFCDIDKQGMLISDFDLTPTIVELYNPPYYPDFMERMGYVKEVDYVSYLIRTEEHNGVLPERLAKAGQERAARAGVSILSCRPKRMIKDRVAEITALINESYDEVYGTVPLTAEQFGYYLNKYYSLLMSDFSFVTADKDGNLVGMFFGVPSLSAAFQKARGRLIPWGWRYILQASKTYKTIDLYYIGVKKEYRRTGAAVLMIREFFKNYIDYGFQEAESNPILQENLDSRGIINLGIAHPRKKRRIFKKRLK